MLGLIITTGKKEIELRFVDFCWTELSITLFMIICIPGIPESEFLEFLIPWVPLFYKAQSWIFNFTFHWKMYNYSKTKSRANQRYGEAETKNLKETVWRSRNRHYRVTETQDPCHGFPEKNWLVNCLKIFWFPERWAGLQTPSVWQMPFLSKLIQMVSVSCSQIILKTLKEVKEKTVGKQLLCASL